MIAGNRIDESSRTMVTSLNQLVPLPIEVDPDGDFGQLCDRLQLVTLAAYRHGVFDVDAVADLEGAGGRNAAGDGLRYFFNFLPKGSTRRRDASSRRRSEATSGT